jgi:hypothetical protein
VNDQPLPVGARLLAGGPGAVGVAARSAPLPDPRQEGMRLLLAVAWSISPRPTLSDFISQACLVLPQLRQLDPTLLGSIALSMNLGIGETTCP